MKRGYNAAMKIDITPLEKALAELEENLQFIDAEAWGDNERHRRIFERAAVQAFEFTYEVALNLLRRQMNEIAGGSTKIKRLEFMDFLRAAADHDFIPDAERFFDYREKRNLTSHNYDEEMMRQLLAVLGPFTQDVRFLIEQLQSYSR